MVANTPIPAGAYERLARQLRADMLRKQFLEQMQAARQAEDMKGRHSVGPDTRRQAHPDLISNALLAGTLGGAMSAAGLPAVGLRAGLIGGGLTDATLNAGNPEGGAEISGALAAAGALGRHSIPAAIAALGASSSEAQAAALQKMKQLFYHGSNQPLRRGKIDGVLDVSPQRRVAEYFANKRVDQLGGTPSVYEVLADPFAGRKHGLALPFDRINDSTPNFTQARELSEKDRPLKLRVGDDWQELAGGGAIKRLGKRAMSQFDELRPSSVAPQGALSVVKPKGGNWLAGSVEDALSPLKERLGEVDPARLAVIRDRLGDPTAGNVGEVLNSWIEGPLTKYVKTRMASPDDEVRRLAEQGVLHFEPHGIRDRSPIMEKVVARRESAGFPLQGLADSPLGDQWEKYSDAAIARHTALDLSAAERDATFGGKQVPKDTVVHAPIYTQFGPHAVENLGFNHLIDELSNALNPESGLPRNLQLSPEAVANLSMEKAVRRVADINAHRAEQQAAANAELANKAMVVREYTDPALPNPKGLRWVELKANQEPTEGMQRAKIRGRDVWVDENGIEVTPGRAELERQLKYEGDTMGHCVGGYCPDVLEGRSRIFSLRDAKGEPHVTVEVSPPDYMRQPFEQMPDPTGKYDSLHQLIQETRHGNGDYEDMARKIVQEYKIDLPHKIVQIKGKQNKAPNPEYLPFVQDFVRNNPLGGSWGDVGDLHNTGLQDTSRMFRPEAIPEWPSRYMSDKDITDWMIQAAPKEPFAAGGSVTKHTPPADIQGIIAAMKEYHANA